MVNVGYLPLTIHWYVSSFRVFISIVSPAAVSLLRLFNYVPEIGVRGFHICPNYRAASFPMFSVAVYRCSRLAILIFP